jgi:hypothetical protein
MLVSHLKLGWTRIYAPENVMWKGKARKYALELKATPREGMHFSFFFSEKGCILVCVVCFGSRGQRVGPNGVTQTWLIFSPKLG